MITFIAMLLASNRSRATDARAKDRAGSPLDVARRSVVPPSGETVAPENGEHLD